MIREAKQTDLQQILELYLNLHEIAVPEYSEHLSSTWNKIMNDENQCYKMMLLTGSKEDKILEFYRSAGYNSSDKTAFIQWLDYE